MTGLLLKVFIPLFVGLGLLSWHATRGKPCHFVPDEPEGIHGTVVCDDTQKGP